MLGTNKLALWVCTGAFAVTTVFFNTCIFLMNLMKYKKEKKWSPSETIIMALTAASVLHQLLCYFWMTMDEVDIECHVAQETYTVLLVMTLSLKFTIMWDTGFLTFYYSVKLVTTPNDCYTQIQTIILKHVTMVAFLIPLCGMSTCMPMLAVFHADNQTSGNVDCGVLVPDTLAGNIYEIIYLLLADVLPGVLMAKSCISISVNLALHLRHMKASTNGAHRPKLGSQMRVIQMALSIVFIYAVFFAVDIYVNYQIVVNHENAINLTFLFTSVYTTGTAVVLIYGKRTQWKLLLHDFNVFVDEYPCLTCLKVPEQKTKPSTPAKIKSEKQ